MLCIRSFLNIPIPPSLCSQAVSAALPMLTLNPTSGVDLDNAGDFLTGGASSIGLVAPLFPPDMVANGDWDGIRANAQKVIGNVKPTLP